MGATPRGISGSRAAAIIGLSKYATPFTVWQEIMEDRQPGFNAKQGFDYEPFEGNAATEFGLAFEDAVCKLTEGVDGHTVLNREGEFAIDDIEALVTCHIDGQVGHLTTLFEGKTCNNRVFGFDWGEPGTDRVPQATQVQAQHNMMCSGLTSALISVLVFPGTVQDFEALGWKAHHDSLNGIYFLKNHETDLIVDPIEWARVFQQIGNFHQYHIDAKPDTQKILLELYDEFWRKYVLGEVAPDAVNYADIRRMFTDPKGTLVVNEDIAEQMREYKSIGKEIGKSGFLEKRRAFLKTQILKFAKDETTVADDESQEKIVFRDEQGKKVGQFDGKTYRA